MPLLNFKSGKIYPVKQDRKLPAKQLFFGGYVPSTLTPGEGTYAYDGNIVGSYYMPAEAPHFDLELMKKRRAMSTPSLPQLTIDTKKGHSGTVRALEHQFNSEIYKYQQIINKNNNPDIDSRSEEARQQMNKIASMSADNSLYNKLTNEKEFNDKGLEEARKKGFAREFTIDENDNVPVIDHKTNQKLSIPVGLYQHMKTNPGDPNYLMDDNGKKYARFEALNDQKLYQFAEQNVLLDKNGEPNAYLNNMHPEIGYGINDKDFNDWKLSKFSGLGNEEVIRKQFEGVRPQDQLLFLSDRTKKVSTNVKQVAAAIDAMYNGIGPGGKQYIYSKIINNNNEVRVPGVSEPMVFDNLSDPAQKEKAVKAYLYAEAQSHFKMEDSELHDVKEASDRAYKQKGVAAEDARIGVRAYASELVSQQGELKSVNGKVMNYPTQGFALHAGDKVFDDESKRPLYTMANNPEVPGEKAEMLLPFRNSDGRYYNKLKNKEATVPYTNNYQISLKPYRIDEMGNKIPLEADRLSTFEKVDPVMKQANNSFKQNSEAYDKQEITFAQYKERTQEILTTYNKELKSNHIHIQLSQEIPVLTQIPKGEYEKINESLKADRDFSEAYLKDVSDDNYFATIYNNAYKTSKDEAPISKFNSSKNRLVKTVITIPTNVAQLDIIDRYRKQANVPVEDAARAIGVSQSQNHKEGGKIEFKPLTLDDIQ